MNKSLEKTVNNFVSMRRLAPTGTVTYNPDRVLNVSLIFRKHLTLDVKDEKPLK